jgi:DNA gyrase inhibitor GyrI
MAIESPNYNVESNDGNIEIRKYDDYIVAQVDLEADYNSALNKGFRILANYIFGGNHQKSKISMTAPVTGENLSDSEKIPMTVPVTEESINEEESEKIAMTAPVTEEKVSKSEKIKMTAPVAAEEIEGHIYRISFTMPSKYTLESLPIPDDDRIKFKELKNNRAAVIRFSGRAKEKLAEKEIKELKIWLKDKNIKPKSNFIVAQYNNPLVPGFLRKNEIIVQI